MKKCEAININSINNVYSKNGRKIKHTNEAEYLGCLLNDDVEAKKEMNEELRTRSRCGKSLQISGKTEMMN